MHPILVLPWLLFLATLAGILLRPRGIAEVWWACGGALLLVATGQIPIPRALGAVRAGTDVYLFLAGMMVLAEMAREEGVFDWAAGLAASHAKGSPRRLFFLVYLVGIAVTALLSNDATAVVLTPAVLTVARRLGARPEPYLLACALVANAGSFLFPISNPANLVLFGTQIPPFLSWIRIFFLPSAAALAVTFVVLRVKMRGNLENRLPDTDFGSPLSTEGRLALAGLLAAAAALIGSSAMGWPLGLPTCAAAVVALGVVATRNPKIISRVCMGVSWSVLPLVAGLFVLVEAMEGAGLLPAVRAGLSSLAEWPPLAAKLAAAFGFGLISNIMNNLPVGLIGAAAVQGTPVRGVLAHAVLIGVDLGPNLSVAGSLATILWLIVLRREGVEMSGRAFLRVGAVAMPLALAASVLLLWR